MEINNMKIIYTRPDDGGLSVVIAAPKADIEKVLGPISQEHYENLVWLQSVPAGAINARVVSDSDIPANREFRNAWADVSESTTVDVDLAKAKEIKLAALRQLRNERLDALDKDFILALEKGEDLSNIKTKKQALRDATEPLKGLQVSGFNDEDVLQQIRTLGELNV
jgi:hypothetical protein